MPSCAACMTSSMASGWIQNFTPRRTRNSGLAVWTLAQRVSLFAAGRWPPAPRWCGEAALAVGEPRLRWRPPKRNSGSDCQTILSCCSLYSMTRMPRPSPASAGRAASRHRGVQMAPRTTRCQSEAKTCMEMGPSLGPPPPAKRLQTRPSALPSCSSLRLMPTSEARSSCSVPRERPWLPAQATKRASMRWGLVSVGTICMNGSSPFFALLPDFRHQEICCSQRSSMEFFERPAPARRHQKASSSCTAAWAFHSASALEWELGRSCDGLLGGRGVQGDRGCSAGPALCTEWPLGLGPAMRLSPLRSFLSR
mmetsp:Transcript_107197/g.345904  ORF Transcript_107197/g.345904 Transcript_107197/m.345904 type:complete len:310 (-) Transcript_107197:414-1343(-)